MDVQALIVPYDSGHRGERMGRGPLHFEQRGLSSVLVSAGHHLFTETIASALPFPSEISTAFELHRLIAVQAQRAITTNRFPLLLSGNCNSSLGVMAGINPEGLGLIWLDAHGDFNTPETTEGGFLDGMGLAIATGRCWRILSAKTPGFLPIREANVLHVGGRDFDSAEQQLMENSEMSLIRAEAIHHTGIDNALNPVLNQLRSRVERVYIHLDLDVLDPALAPANRYSAPGGFSVEQVDAILRKIGAHFQIVAAGVASYDPGYDQGDRILWAGFHLIQTVLSLAR
jgi:arginase